MSRQERSLPTVVSKDELDYNALNAAISGSNRATFTERVNEALQSIMIRSARYNNTADGIYFKVDANSNKAVAAVVTIDKK